jgi:hypothetical protein
MERVARIEFLQEIIADIESTDTSDMRSAAGSPASVSVTTDIKVQAVD